MAVNFLIQLLVGVGLQLIGYLIMPKPAGPKPPSMEDYQDPTAEAGRPIPVVFGSITVSGLNNMGHWDKSIEEREEEASKSG